MGCTLFCAPWAVSEDQARFDEALETLAADGFDYYRAIGVLGGTSWEDRSTPTWPLDQWARVQALMIDRGYDVYGRRCELSILGGLDNGADTRSKREQIAQAAVDVVRARASKVFLTEYGNELDGEFPREELKTLGDWLQSVLPGLAAPTSYSHDSTGEAAKDLYSGRPTRGLTCHVERGTGGDGGVYEPIWSFREAQGIPNGPPVRISDEPVGPYSSGYSEMDPDRIAAAAVLAWMCGAAYTYHPGPGKRLGGAWDAGAMPATLAETPGWAETIARFRAMRALLPAGMANWRQWNGHWQDSPIRSVNGNVPFDTGQLFRGCVVADGDRRIGLYLWVRGAAEFETDRELQEVTLTGDVVRSVSGRFTLSPERPINLYVRL